MSDGIVLELGLPGQMVPPAERAVEFARRNEADGFDARNAADGLDDLEQELAAGDAHVFELRSRRKAASRAADAV